MNITTAQKLIIVDKITVTVTGGELDLAEINNYIAYGREQYADRLIEGLDIEVDGDSANLSFRFAPMQFQRIRRITGYLVGTLDRFNDAKRTEVGDRVKHSY
ncbi:MAG: anaerobic ribonucleoside-triphosphate reductase [Oscillospiraceae bacterium]